MWHLTKSELLRFRTPALVGGLAHFLVLAAVATSAELFAPSEAKLVLGGMSYALCGLIFGLYQLGTYKRRDHWIYLMHRPLSPGRIFMALSGAAAILFSVAFVLPLFVVTLFLDQAAGQWVDLRQYLMTPFVFGTVLSFYFAGCYIMLSAGRIAFVVLVLPFFFLTAGPVGPWVFLPQLAVVLWLGFLAFSAFKPNLETHLRRPLAVVLGALPVQYVFFWASSFAALILYSTIVAFQEHGWRSYAVHAWDEYFPAGTYSRTVYLDASEALAHGLRAPSSERGRRLLKRLESAEAYEVLPRFLKTPVRGQPMFMDGNIVLNDRKNGVRWTFSHDRMMFHGRDARSKAPVGWLGVSHRRAQFPDVPEVVGERQLMTRQRIYELDPEERSVELRFGLDGDERFVTPLAGHGGFATALTDRAFYLFDPPSAREPLAVVPLPGEVRNLSRAVVAKLAAGYVLSFISGRQSRRGYHEARQIVSEIDAGGACDVVADSPLDFGPPAWNRYSGFILSPFVQNLHDVVWTAIEPYREGRVGFGEIVSRPVPRPVLGWALLVAVASAALTAWCGRRRQLGRAGRRAWIVAAFLLGLPGLLSFLFLTDRRSTTC